MDTTTYSTGIRERDGAVIARSQARPGGPAVIHIVGRFWGFVGDTLGLAGPRALCGAWLSYRAAVPDPEPPPGTPTCPACVSKLGQDPAGGRL